MKKPLIIFVAIPLLINLLLIGLYFSGSTTLQQWVAPTIDWLPRNSWREFGLLEMLQNLFLLAVIGILLLTAVRASYLLDKLCFVGAAAVFLFLFAEEIDYGIHFYEFVTGEYSGIEQRNWHNQRTDGEQNVKRFKQLMDVTMALLFIVLPLAKNRIPIAFLQTSAPLALVYRGLCGGHRHGQRGAPAGRCGAGHAERGGGQPRGEHLRVPRAQQLLLLCDLCPAAAAHGARLRAGARAGGAAGGYCLTLSRMMRCFWRFQSRSFSVSRLS